MGTLPWRLTPSGGLRQGSAYPADGRTNGASGCQLASPRFL